ncbi:MAG: hypothetical protein K1X88_04135 [Nannocystaceae bacterium]|nr:hypothetical protein [Nannocystaceae bacterium]
MTALLGCGPQTPAPEPSTGADDAGSTSSTGAASSSTSSADESTTAEAPDFGACADQGTTQACVALPQCVWSLDFGQCIARCSLVPDEATCSQLVGCFWQGECIEDIPI